jgi:Prolyl oligopeptidase family
MRAFALRVLAGLALALGSISGTTAAVGPVLDQGSIDHAAYKIEIPANWNGTLLLYSHGYVVPGESNPARDVGDAATGTFLLSQGYALAGSAYSTTGWAVKEALHDQIALLDYFDKTYGEPKRTLAWGHSLGGMITAGLVQRDASRFAGALPMCGVLAGGVGVWNVGLDAEFVFKTLLGPGSSLQLVNITDPSANLQEAELLLTEAQATPQGQARLALMAAVGDLPGWFVPGSPEPPRGAFAERELNQFLWDQQVDFPFLFAFRAELEGRAGGNPSWNTDVNYARQLARSINRDEVRALYVSAGLDLQQDLAALAAAPRIDASPAAVDYLTQNVVFNGDLGGLPVLTIHTTGDGLVLNQDEQAYARIVDERRLLRQAFVDRAGHCTFTPAETIAALDALVRRLDTGFWSGVDPAALNADANGLGLVNAALAPAPAGYIAFTPTAFPRPFSADED